MSTPDVVRFIPNPIRMVRSASVEIRRNRRRYVRLVGFVLERGEIQLSVILITR
jgi:hypothetical protein